MARSDSNEIKVWLLTIQDGIKVVPNVERILQHCQWVRHGGLRAADRGLREVEELGEWVGQRQHLPERKHAIASLWVCT